MTVATRFAGLLVTVAMLSAFCPATSAEDELGRLFFTPERRQNLDRQRQLNIQETQQVAEDPTFTINGVVARSNGKRTVWVNGVAQNENELPGGVLVVPKKKDPGRVVVHTTESLTANAKVGDTVNRNTGESSDLLGDGQITIRPVGKAPTSPSQK